MLVPIVFEYYLKEHFTESTFLLKRLMKNGHQTNIMRINFQIMKFPIPPNHQVFALNLDCENSSTVLDRTEEMGYWTKDKRFIDYGFGKNTIRRRKSLEGTKLNICIVITNRDSLNHLTDKRDKHIDSIAKVNYVLVEHLKDIINATLNYSVQPTWGYKDNNSGWSGMIGELTRHEADIGGTPLFFTIDRVDIIDYVAMTTPTRSKFVFQQPKLSYVKNVYTLPFDTKVWVSTICLIVIMGFVMYVIIKWEWKKWRAYARSSVQSSVPEVKDSVTDIVVFTFGAACQQGSSSIPFSIPGRITAIMLYVSLMFLYTSYSANIVALLQSSSDSIQTLEDLLKSRLQIGVDDTVFNRFYFPNSVDPVRRALYLQKVAPRGKKDNFMPIEEGVRKMRKGLFAFHMETGSGYKIVSETFQEGEKCGLKEIQFLQVIDPWFVVRKNSTYKELIKIGEDEAAVAGFFRLWGRPKCSGKRGLKPEFSWAGSGLFINGPELEPSTELLRLYCKNLRILVGLLIGHCPMKKHLKIIGVTANGACKMVGGNFLSYSLPLF
ncbi:hypothetical protein NQ318_009013 [Aromia moschata]|uniref:Uncharacterized protein n=1 Tax=Aromia moschata TaxID=1265417 RepID=A0AAV8YSZ0_9CUCU|nr:hypothetical protein NQ318_009013 [Aromia moschata]